MKNNQNTISAVKTASWEDTTSGISYIGGDYLKFMPNKFWKTINIKMLLTGKENLWIDPHLKVEIWTDKCEKVFDIANEKNETRAEFTYTLNRVCSFRIEGKLSASAPGYAAHGRIDITVEYDEIPQENPYGPKVNDVPKAFRTLPENGQHEKFYNLPQNINIVGHHIGGYSQYENFGKIQYFFVRNDDNKCFLIATDANNSKNSKEILISNKWSHPGGTQTIADNVLIPCEKNEESRIFVYNFTEDKMLSNGIQYRGDDGEVTDSFKHKAASVGITEFSLPGNKRCLLMLVCAVSNEGTAIHSWCHAYISPLGSAPLDLNSQIFNYVGKFFLENKDKDTNIALDCQGIGLVTDTNNKVYLVALHSYQTITYDDWAFLFELTVTESSISEKRIDARHFISKGGISGVDGTHFRWGTGIHIKPYSDKPDARLVLLATSRNILQGGNLDTNHW